MKISAFSKTYGKNIVLKLPDLHLEEGRIYGIIGANGSGKSTFARILAGVLESDQKKNPLDSRITVGYMPQKSYAYRMKVRSNILLACRDEKRAEELMEALSLSHLANRRADRLSGGETARMAMARLMMKSFKLVIMDEPTASMDIETTSQAEKQMLKYCRETGCTMILVTHSLHQARRVADEVLFFRKGELVERGSRDALLYNPQNPETKRFLEFYGA